MRKRIIALLLALILTVGLLPTVALAADGTTDGGSTGTISGGTVQVAGDPKQSVEHEAADDPIHIKKSVSKGTDGKDYLTMEAYVTNPLEIKQEAVPIDIVLVLDVSGSMDDPLRKETVPDFERYPNNMTNSDYLHYAQTGYGVYSAEKVDTKISVTATDNYERVTRLTYGELERSGNNVSYYAYAKDSNGKYHSLKIDRYWFSYYLYIDNQRNQKVDDWNSQIQLPGYEIYKVDSNKTTYTYTNTKTGVTILTSTGLNSRPTNSGQVVTFYYYNGETQKKVYKINALKEAANNFIAKVAEQKLPAGADGKAQYNRISIVKFAGEKSNNVGDDKYRESRYTYNYSQIVKSLTNVDAGGVTALQKAVNDLEPAGATRADYGMEKAQEALKDHGTRPSVVIMFTDGSPTSSNVFEAPVASAAVTAAKALKDAGTLVYTIAVEKDAHPEAPIEGNEAKNINKYLHAVSSNYPNATANSNGDKFNVTFGTRVSSEKNYYFNATNAIGLNNVFETISREVSNLALVVDSTANLSDTLSDYFSFDVDVTTKAGITVKRVPVIGGNATTGFTWAAINDDSVTNIDLSNVTINGKSITVTGFNYGSEENAVTVHADGRVTGAKLVITFPIKPDDSATWTEGTVNYPTNSTTSPNEAGLRNYALKSDKDNKNQQTQLTESPEIQIKAHTVSYEVAGNGNTGYTVPNSEVYREGQPYTIEGRLLDSNGYKFTGWCKDDRTCTSTPTTDPQTMGTTNVTYYGKFEKNEVTVDLSKFVQKKLELTGVTELPTEERFTVTLTEGSTTLIATTDAMKSTPGASNLPTFKNGLQSVKLSVGQHTFKVKETVGSTSGMTYDSAEYTLTVTANANGTAAANTVTITNTYTKPTYAVGKFVIESAASDDFPIKGVNADDYQYPTNGKYIVEKTYTSDTITFLYVIKVSGNQGAVVKIQETGGGEFAIKDSTDSRANIVWNEAEQSYTVTLNQAVDASDPIKLYAKKTFTKVEGKFPTTAANALLVNGEDGPKQNTTIEERGTLTVDFGALVHKHLTVTGDKSFNGTNFTVNFTEGLYAPLAVNNSIEVYADAGVGEEKLPDLTASVTYTADERDRGLKDFDGADLTINTEGNYSYIVSEQIPAGATGYDTKKYVVGIVVVTHGDGLKVEHVWYHELVEDLATHPEIIPGGPTFHNTIDTGKDDYYPIIIPTIINKDTGMLNKTDHFAYVIGYPDGTVHPNGQITRAEVATIFFRLLRDKVRDGAFTTSNSYSDVAYGKWYNNPISTMSALGIITGYPDGTFKPNKPITRAEFAAIAARFDETQSGKSATFSDVIGHWAAKEIGIAYYNDWIKGYPDGTFKPDQNITRAEAMTLINRVLERKPESPADLLTNMNKWTDNMDTSKWYYLDVQEATNSHGHTRKTFNYELWRQMLPDPDWSRYER